MRLESASDRENRKKKKKQQESQLEKMIFSIMEKGIEEAMKQALDNIFKDWK